MHQRVLGYVVALVLVMVLVLPMVVGAQPLFTITGSAFGGSGGVSNGGVYTLTGSLTPNNAQPLHGGEYTVHVGIFLGQVRQHVYLPIVCR